jgi:hypothetical protein
VSQALQFIVDGTTTEVLLVDLPESSSVFPVGTIVSVGTYGKPYLAKGDDRWRPLRSSHNLPNFSEQDIIVINLDVRAEPEPVGDEMPIDVKPINGVVDPRPFAMRVFEDWADRIFANGVYLWSSRPMPTSNCIEPERRGAR